MIKKLKNKLEGDVHLKELLTGSAIAFILKSLGILLNFVLFYVITNQIGGAGLGFYNSNLQLLIVLGTFGALGLNQAILRFVGQYSKSNFPKLIFYYKKAFILVGVASITLGLLLFFFSPLIVSTLNLNENYTKSYRLISISLPLYSISLVSIEFIRGLKKIQLSEILRSVMQPGLIILLALTIQLTSNIEIILSLFIACLLVFLSSSFLVYFILKQRRETAVKSDTTELFSTGFPLLVSNSSSVLLGALPIFFLGFYIDELSVGLFSLNFKIASLVATALFIINTIAAPKISELYWNREREELEKLIFQVSKIMFVSSLLICSIILILGEYVLVRFDDNFESGFSSLLALTVGQFINGLTGSVGIFMSVTGHQKALRNIILIAVLAIFCCYSFIVPTYGLLGASIISALGASIINISCVIYIKRNEGIYTYYTPWRKSKKLTF